MSQLTLRHPPRGPASKPQTEQAAGHPAAATFTAGRPTVEAVHALLARAAVLAGKLSRPRGHGPASLRGGPVSRLWARSIQRATARLY
jgi:hypothetical protein